MTGRLSVHLNRKWLEVDQPDFGTAAALQWQRATQTTTTTTRDEFRTTDDVRRPKINVMSIFVFNQIKLKFCYKKNSKKVFAVLLSKKVSEPEFFFHPLVRWSGRRRSEASEAKSLSIYSDRLGLSFSPSKSKCESASSLESRLRMNSGSRWATT